MLGPFGLEENDCQNRKKNTINISISLRFLDLIIDYEFDQSS